VGNVSPLSITASLAKDEFYRQTVSLALPNTGALTNLVDVFLLFDDTGSFVNNSPIVRSAFPDIINQLQTALPGIDLGFGVGRLEEYGSFASEYATGRPFILNQPIVAASTSGYMAAIQAALNRTTPGYGGDQPETDIEALYQVVTGLGFDGNNNGSVLDSGAAGLASTQLNPGGSGDVPSFASFMADPAASVMAPAGTIGGVGFRPGALPIILTATDTGFAYQPQGETTITGVGGLTLPVSALTGTSRPTTPYNSGAGIQQTITGLNALGALVIGLGTNPQANVDPRQGLEALSKLTGAINQSGTTIANGTADPIAPGDPLYFQIASGFSASVASGVVSAIQNAVTNVAVNITVQASDPRVKIINHTGVLNGVAAGQTATLDVEFVGDGVPHRFDLQFVRAGTNVVLGSIPVVLGTPIPGDGYEFEDLEEGEIEFDDDFGGRLASSGGSNVAPSFAAGADQAVAEDSGVQTIAGWATNISPGPASEAGQSVNFLVSNDANGLFSAQPAISPDGTLTYTPALNAFGTATVSVQLHDDGGTADGGEDTSSVQTFTIAIRAENDAPVLAAIGAQSVHALATLTFTATATDVDQPANTLTYSLDAVSMGLGMTIHGTTGEFTWTPTVAHGLASYAVTLTVTDNGSPAASDSETFTIAVAGPEWQNPRHPCDVGDDGYLTAADVLALVTEINANGARGLTTATPSTPAPPPFLDPSGDGRIAPIDVLIVINYLNTFGAGPVPASSGGEGEGPAMDLQTPFQLGAMNIAEDSPTNRPTHDLGEPIASVAGPTQLGRHNTDPRTANSTVFMPDALQRRAADHRAPEPGTSPRFVRPAPLPARYSAHASETTELEEAISAIAATVAESSSLGSLLDRH
jgi:hypothetical protein